MTTQVLFFHVFSEKDSHLNAVEWNLERVSNIKPFTNTYSWKRINHTSKIDDWITFEKNNPTIALNILYIKKKNQKKLKNAQLISQKLIRIVKK